MQDETVTLRDRDSLEQVRIKTSEVVSEVQRRLRG
jgi:glycyl-tRNA synthetase (class II)